MTDPKYLLARHLVQRAELGEPPIVLGSKVDEILNPALQVPDRSPSGASSADADAASERAGTETNRSTDSAPMRRKAAAGPAGARWLRDAPAIPPRGIVVSAPPEDLFSADPLAQMDLDAIAEAVRSCEACSLCDSRTNTVPGEGPGTARLVVVGEGPGATEDETGRPFVGRAGELLTQILVAIDLPREQVFICNILKCRPPKNRKPLPDEIQSCVPYLFRQLENIRPAVILAMGGTAAETLLNTRQSLGSLRNKVHEFRGMPLVVTYHPAALLRNPHWKKPTWDDVRIARQLVDRHG